ncbi:coiled-coil domain-containing protein [Carboxylicivirga linearis]|uniref:Chromosome segregation protein SMC n=1 Tax=Carboxylicivirga linearis TaxID=1628157 RepID=A0ABS5K0W2_9BACT|nr:hypothetical protein [Carboxylicivirga linearis]MBS2100803.1 hypothetical protein [Carboxylicivirga linearis]
MENKAPQASNKKLIYIISAVAVVLIAVVFVMYLQNRQEYKAVVEEMTEEKDLLTEEFQTLALDYDSLQSNNDTLNLMLEQEREKISHLIEEIKTIKATNASKIREYKKELTSLRSVMRNFVVQIDSLNQRNQELSEENQQYRKQVNKIQDSYNELEKQKETLAKKVDIASKLETYNYEVEGLNSKDRETKKARNVSKIRVCFTIQKNITAPIGEKTVYLRVLRPDEALLVRSLDDKFEYEEEEINYSARRVIEYGGEELDVCVFYKADEGELLPGTYTVDIFADGFNIGTTTFELK